MALIITLIILGIVNSWASFNHRSRNPLVYNIRTGYRAHCSWVGYPPFVIMYLACITLQNVEKINSPGEYQLCS